MQEGLFVVVCGDYVDFPSVSLWPRLESSQGRGRSEGMGRGARCRANWLQLDTAVLSQAPMFVSVCLFVYNLFLQGCHLCVLNILPICTNTCTHKIRSPGRNRWKAKRRELLFYRSTRRVGGAAVTHFVWPCGFAFIGLSRIMKATENSHTYLMMVARFLC